MANGTIKNAEYYQSGDVIEIRGSFRAACCFSTSCSIIIPLTKRIKQGTTFTASLTNMVVRLNGNGLPNVSFKEIEYRDGSNELALSFNLTGGTNYVPCIASCEGTITVN